MKELLKELCLAFSPAGEENEVKDIIIKNLDESKNEWHTDKLGNLVVRHKGEKQKENVGFFSFMHEAGLMTQLITDDGFVKFVTVGCQKENIPEKSFYCKNRDLYAVVSGRTWHTSTKEERNSQAGADKLVLDFGARDKEDALKHIRPSDQFVYEANFRENMDGSFSCKAMERSASAIALINALNSDIEKEFFCVFVSGGKGSAGALRVPAGVNKISVGVILEAMGAGDNPFSPAGEKTCSMKKGFNIAFSESRVMYNKDLVSFIADKAEEKKVPYQVRTKARDVFFPTNVMGAGDGVKTALLGLPVEYPNSPSTTVFPEDIASCEAIVKIIAEEVNSL